MPDSGESPPLEAAAAAGGAGGKDGLHDGAVPEGAYGGVRGAGILFDGMVSTNKDKEPRIEPEWLRKR